MKPHFATLVAILAVLASFITLAAGDAATTIGTHVNSETPAPKHSFGGMQRFLLSWKLRTQRRELSTATQPPDKQTTRRNANDAFLSTDTLDRFAALLDSVGAPTESFDIPEPTRTDPLEILEPPWPNSPMSFNLASTAATQTAAQSQPVESFDIPEPTQTDPLEIVEPQWPNFPISFETTSTQSTLSASPSQTDQSSPSSSLRPHPASDSIWEEAANKGCRMVDALRSAEQDAGQLFDPPVVRVQSSFTNYQDFLTWGWTSEEVQGTGSINFDGGQKSNDSGLGIGNALRDLKISDKGKHDGGKNIIIDALHGKFPFDGKTYTAKDGKSYPMTGGQYKMVVNVEDGVLMALDRHSPVSAARERNPPVASDKLPAIRTFSDIGYLNYKNILGKDPSNLQYMMSVMVTNEKTKSIITRALESNGESLGPWPGAIFEWRSREFKALLGTPNGMGFGYLLIQHKDQLGDMFMTQVQVFAGDTWHQSPNMVFTVKAKTAQDPPPKPPGTQPQMEGSDTISVQHKIKREDIPNPKVEIARNGEKSFRRDHVVHFEL